MNIYELIENSHSLDELRENKVLPDPYDDSGFYYVYYAQADYKTVLPEIMGYIDNGLRIYYNRYYDRSKSFTADYLAKVKSVHCRCAVIYLSEEAIKDPVFYQLLNTISETGCNYLSVNLPVNGKILSGEQIAEECVDEPERARLLKELFKNEITYIPSTFSLPQKIEELTRAYRTAPIHYSLCGDFAVADYVYDLQEDNIIIPQSVLLGGKEYIVKAVARGAFANCENLKKIVFPETIEYIGFLGYEFSADNDEGGSVDEDDLFEAQSRINQANGTFYRCKSLEEIVYPPKVKRLYKYEFCGCTSLKRIILNKSLKFYRLNDFATNDGFFEFGEFFFEEDKEYETEFGGEQSDDNQIILESLTVPQSICKTYDDRFKICFSDANNLWMEAELPAKEINGYLTVEKREEYFLNPQTMNLPDVRGVIKVEYDNDWKMSDTLEGEYSDCTELTEAILPDFVEGLSDTFSGCSSLEKVKLPKNLKHIFQAFAGCESLSRIDLPEGLETIDSCAFMNTALEEIKLPPKVMMVDKDAFCGCFNLHTIISDSAYNKWLFKRRRNYVDRLISHKHKRWFYIKTFLSYLTLPILHPIIFISSIIHRKELREQRLRFFEVCVPENIYLKEGTGKFKIKGYKKIKSDKSGYIKYIKRR